MKEKIKIQSREKNIYLCIQMILIFMIYMFFQLKNLNAVFFESDEVDIFINGIGIAKGKYLYSDLLSQHMPFSYYISAIFAKMGAMTMTKQRIYFYTFFALLWVYIINCYGKYVKKIVLCMYPLFYMSAISTYDLGYAILSEHIAGIGFVILFLELYEFDLTKKIRIKNCINISIAILMTFGTIFVAAFGVCVIGVAVIAIEINDARSTDIKVHEFLNQMIQKYYKLVLIVASPWLILCIRYILTNRMKLFYISAYQLNREIYPKYNGYGESILSTILGMFEQVHYAWICFFDFTSFSYSRIVQVILYIAVINCFVFCWRKKKKIIAGVIVFLPIVLMTRGAFNFHGTQFVAIASFFCVLVLFENETYKNLKMWITFFVCIVLVQNISGLGKLTIKEIPSSDSVILRKLTDENESIGTFMICNNAIMLAGRTTCLQAATVPWMWEAFKNTQLEQLYNAPPRVIMYDDDYVLWGYSQKDYAHELVEYVTQNYTRLYGSEYIYVRNDVYTESYKKIGVNPVIPIIEFDDIGDPIGNLCKDNSVVQSFVLEKNTKLSAIDVYVGTYARQNSDIIGVEIVDSNSDILYSTTFSTDDLVDNSWKSVMIDTQLFKGKQYFLKFSSVEGTIENSITFYREQNENENDLFYCIINGQVQDGNMAIRIYEK